MTQAITFDFHNTLISCDPWFELEVRTLCGSFLSWQSVGGVDPALKGEADRRYRVLRQAIIEHGNERTAEECVRAVLGEMSLAIRDDDIAHGVEAIMMATLADAAPIPGALNVVQELAAANYALAIVSSAVYHPFLDAALEKFGFAGLFQSVVTSASSGFYKSRPEIYWSALDQIGVRREHAVHVGDSYRFDVLGAKRAGLATVWLSDDPEAKLKSPAPDAVVASLIGASPAIRATLPRRL